MLAGASMTAESATTARPATIADLNDAFRRSLTGGRIMLTPGVTALGEDGVRDLLKHVAAFHGFTLDNDPFGEHDFGSITIQAETFFWKIDAYDRACEYGSPNPLDPAATCRVLTVMRADEY
jgi:hypothetical protein